MTTATRTHVLRTMRRRMRDRTRYVISCTYSSWLPELMPIRLSQDSIPGVDICNLDDSIRYWRDYAGFMR